MQIFFDKRLWTDQGLFGEDYVLTIVIAATTSAQLIITSLTYFVSANKNAVLLWWPLIDDIRVVLILLLRLFWLYYKEKRILPSTLFILNVLGAVMCVVGFPVYAALISQKDDLKANEALYLVAGFCVIFHFIVSLPILLLLVARKEVNAEVDIRPPANSEAGHRVEGSRNRIGHYFGGRRLESSETHADNLNQNESRRTAEQERRRIAEQRRAEEQERQRVAERERLNLMRSQDEAFALAANQDAERERGFESVSQERDKEDGIEVRVRFPDGSTFNFVAYSAQKVAFIYSKVADEIKKKNLPFKKFKLIDSNGMKQLDDKNALISVRFKTRNVFMLVKAA